MSKVYLKAAKFVVEEKSACCSAIMNIGCEQRYIYFFERYFKPNKKSFWWTYPTTKLSQLESSIALLLMQEILDDETGNL